MRKVIYSLWSSQYYILKMSLLNLSFSFYCPLAVDRKAKIILCKFLTHNSVKQSNFYIIGNVLTLYTILARY